MFKNILIGQYIDTGSPLQRIDARIKIIITLILAVMIFSADKIGLIYAFAICIVYVTIAKLGVSVLLRSIKPVLLLAAFAFVFDLFLTDGRTLFSVWIFHATYEGLYDGVKAALRLILLVAEASVLTLSTKPLDLTDAIESLLKPLVIFKIPVRDIAMMMGITIRFIPTIGSEAQRIIEAQKSRCADFDGKGIIKKAHAVLPIIIPLIISVFRRSEVLADAMDSRCYGAGKRTHMREHKINARDIAALILTVILVGGLPGVQMI